jgi:hypothetical protein
MKIFCLFLFLFSFSTAIFAQQDTTEVYNSFIIGKDPKRAAWRPVLWKNANLWQLDFYDKKGVIQETISYESDKLEVRKGLYLSYQQGKIVEKGNYEKGYKHGWWTTLNLAGDTTSKQFYRYGKSIANQ